MAKLDTVTSQLKGLESAANEASDAIGRAGLEDGFRSVGISMKRAQLGQGSMQLRGLAAAALQVQKQLNPLKAEFKALKAEARNIDFGDIPTNKPSEKLLWK